MLSPRLFLHQRLTVLGVLFLLGVMATLAILSMKDDSATTDEIAHVTAGYSYLTQQDYRLNFEKPPLAKDLAALPLLFLDLRFPSEHPSWTNGVNDYWGVGQAFFYELGNNPDQILFWARIPMLLFLIGLGVLLFLWTKELAGVRAALGALFLLGFSPLFLAHGRLVTLDVPSAFGLMATLYFFTKFLRHPSSLNAVVVGIFLSVALLISHATTVVIVVLGVLSYVWISAHDGFKERIRSYLAGWVLMGVLVIGAIGIVYHFHTLNYPVERQKRDAEIELSTKPTWDAPDILFHSPLRAYTQYATGLFLSMIRTSHQRITYFLGELGVSGWWYYFPVLYFFKNPIPLHIFTFIALGILLTSLRKSFRGGPSSPKIIIGAHFSEFSMLVFIAVWFAVATGSNLNIGVRHILPVMPFVFSLVAVGVEKWLKERSFPSFRLKVGFIAVLLAWYFISSVQAFPYYISYYNELGGGVRNGYMIAVDSNYDWGQDLKRLAQWVDSRHIQKIYVDYFGVESQARYYLGETYIPWRGASMWKKVNPDVYPQSSTDFPKGNYLAVSASFRQGEVSPFEDGVIKNGYDWLQAYEPVDRAGTSFFIYYID